MNEVSFKPTTARQDPLAIPNIIRIPLEHHQAVMLAGLGEMFVVISQASYPHTPGLALLALPVTKDAATAACNVALGTHSAKRIRPATVNPTQFAARGKNYESPTSKPSFIDR